MKRYSLHSPIFYKNTLKNVSRCIKSSWLSPSGNFVNSFEKQIEKLTNSKCVVCNSGTSALHICLMLSKVNSSDEVIVPTMTYIATINAVLYVKASPIFMDCDESLSINLKKVKEFLINQTIKKNGNCVNKKTKKIIKALIVTHVFGNISDFVEIKKLCKKMNIFVIEDAAEAIGSYFKNFKHAGTMGDYGALSFNINKTITSGGGGAVLIKKNSEKKKLKSLISQSKSNSYFFHHSEIGYNYGLSNINAAIGLSQIENLSSIINKKKQIFQIYKKLFKNIKNIKFLDLSKNLKINYWLNSILIENKSYTKFKKIIKNLNLTGIEVRPIWFPCHMQKFLRKYQTYKIEYANQIYKKIICIPSSFFLKKKDLEIIVKKISYEI